jgi:hypothetical protein
VTAEVVKVSINDEGATVDVAILADGFGIDAADVEPLMRQGRLTSRFEKGVGSDAGRSRLTFWLDANGSGLSSTGKEPC